MSPLPITGMFNASFTSLIIDQSAFSPYLCSLVRGCTVIAEAPASSTIPATSRALMHVLSHPLLIFAVTGTSDVSTTVSTISEIFSGFFKSALPAFDLTATFGTGHPIFMSIISGFMFLQIYSVAILNDSASAPNICWEIGRSSGVI